MDASGDRVGEFEMSAEDEDSGCSEEMDDEFRESTMDLSEPGCCESGTFRNAVLCNSLLGCER